MAPILVIIESKGQQFKRYFKLNDNDCKSFIKIYILITNKKEIPYNYHYVCIIPNHVAIPSTSFIPKETGYIHLKFQNNEFVLPLHSIGSLGLNLSTTLNLNINI